MMKSKLSALNDHNLLRMSKEGNSKAFEALFNRYWKRLYTYAYKIYHDDKICEDIVQEVFISLWKRNNDSAILNLEAYLFKAVKYKISKHIRNLNFNLEQIDYLQEIPAAPQNSLEYDQFKESIYLQIEQLPPKCREVFKLSRFEHKSNQEIATRLNLSIRTVETHISNAIKFLKNNLEVLELSLLVYGLFL